MDHVTFAQLLGSYGEFIGSIVVLATLVYLALQTRQNSRVIEQNNRMHEGSMYRANIDGVMNLQAILARDEQLGLIWKRGLADEDLSEAEIARFEAYLNMWFFDLEIKLFTRDQEVGWEELGGESALLGHIDGQIKYLMRSALVRSWWREHAQRMLGPVFVARVNQVAQGEQPVQGNTPSVSAN
jgi:hypothetical protein